MSHSETKSVSPSPTLSPTATPSNVSPTPNTTQTFTVLATKQAAPVLAYKRSLVVRSLADRGSVTLQVLRDKSRGSMLVHYQQGFTGSPFDFVVLGDARCDNVRVDTTTCLALNDCFPTPGHSYFADEKYGTSTSLYNLPIVMGPSTLANPSCRASSIIAAAVVEGDMPFVTVPIYRYAQFLEGTAVLPTSIGGSAVESSLNISVVEPSGAAVRSRFAIVRPFDETATPMFSRGGSISVAHCSIPDVTSFERTEVGSLVDLGTLYSPDCTYAAKTATGADLQAQCLADDHCLALTTTAGGNPLCLLRSGRGLDPYREQEGRWLMTKTKPQERTCSLVASNSGTLKVLLRQTSLASSTAVVFIGNAVVAQCGGLKTFAGGLFGRSSACDTWMACYIGHVRVSDVVSVVASAAMTAGGCDASVGVIFDVVFDAADQTRPPEPRIPNSLSTSNLKHSFPHRLYINNARRSFVNIFAFNIHRIVLSVAQTGYDCTRSPQGYCSRPAVQVILGSTVAQKCGGSQAFLPNVSGSSDQCYQPRFCGMPITISGNLSNSQSGSEDGSGIGTELQSAASSLFADGSSAASGILGTSGGYAGWIQLSVEIATIRYSSSLCQYFGATLFASSNHTSASANISGFVLHSGAGGNFAVLAAPRLGTVISNFTSTLSNAAPLPTIGAVLGMDDMRSVWLVNVTSYLAAVEKWSAAVANTSFACVMDWISGGMGSCVVSVPRGANFMTIRVAQTNFAPSANVMSVVQLDGSASVLTTASCGGTKGFAGLPSLSEQCGVFLPCGGGFLDPSATMIRLSVPAIIGNSATCAVAFAATLDFQFINRTVPASCPFLCAGDRTCVPQSALCNGVVDCSDGTDEAPCNSWAQIELNNIFALTSDTQVLATQVFADCRLAALRNGTNLFAVSRNQSVCILYPASKVASYLADPSPYIIPASNFVMFASMLNGETYGRCTSENSCNGNGQVVESRVGGKLACSCVCNTGFTNSDCGAQMALATQGPVVVSFSTEAGKQVPTPSQVEAAIAQLSNSTDTSVSCSPLVNENGKLLATCTVSGSAADIEAMNLAVTTDVARQKVAGALNISSLDPMTPSTQPLFQAASCGAVDVTNASAAGTQAACSAGGKAIQSIRASITASSGVGEIVLSLVQSQSSQRRRFGAASSSSLRCVPRENNLYETPTRSGCVTTVCFVTIDDPAPVDAVTVSTPTYAGNASSDPCYSAGVEFTVPLLISEVVRASPAKAIDDFSPFLISGVATLVVGGLLLGVASVALRHHMSENRKAVGEMESAHQLKSILTTAVRLMRFDQRRNVRAERWSTAFAVASFDLLVLGIFLALYFVNSSGYTSNVEVLLENYRTSQCDKSTFASLASRATIVPASSSRSCLLRESTGFASGSIFAAAYCDNSTTGGLTVQLKIGSSMSECNTMPFTPHVDGSCVRISKLLSFVNDSSYLLLQCGTTRSIEARFAAFKALNADSSPDVDATRPQRPSDSLAQPRNPLTIVSGYSLFTSNRVSQGSASNVTSSAANRIESAGSAGGSLVVGDSSPQRLVIQLEGDVYDANTDGRATAALETQFPLKAVGGGVSSLGPVDGDYPAGFLYNNFNLPGEVSLFDAGPGAARYYGIRGSLADIGQHYQGGTRSGFTISLYLRCSRSTEGFAFAVADAREDMATSMSPLLSRLMAMLTNGSPGSAWYNKTYNVYSGLFVDGPAAALRFVYANPSQASPETALVDLQWDLTALGLLHLFNGVWHHVAIIIRSENQDTKVQLVVDGVTSTSQNGWNLCPERIPIPVQSLDPAEDVAVRNFQAERVLTDGVLFTGYFNGGVAHLEFNNEKVEIFELWRSSTIAIQSHNALNTTQYIVLGSLLLTIGLVMLGTMLLTSGGEWLQTEAANMEHEAHIAHNAYAELWRKAPKDPQGTPYMPLPWGLALDCMGCDVKTFSVFLDELRFNFRHPPEELVRLLFAKSSAGSGVVNPNIAPPTAAEWHFLVEQSAAQAEGQLDDEELQLDQVVPSGNEMVAVADQDAAVSPLTPFSATSERTLMKVRSRSASMVQNNASASQVSIVFEPTPSFTRPRERKSTEAKGDIKVSTGGGGGGGGGGNDMSKSSRGSSSATTATDNSPSPSELVQSVLGVIQSVSVWQTSLPFPAAHLATFQTVFATFSLDPTALVSISPLVTPLVQLFIGLVVFGVLLFVVESD